MNGRMKIAFVSQPWEFPLRDSQLGSIPTWTYEVARRLAQNYDVIVYSRRGFSRKKVEVEQRIQYRSLLAWGFIKVINLFAKFDDAKSPLFASSLYNLMYALQVAKDLRRQQCDLVHIHNFSQFVPIIRAFNPKIKIVLHMHCEWLTQLNSTMIAKRLHKVDLIVGCSEYITNKVRKKFPQFASRCQTIYNGVNIAPSEQNYNITTKTNIDKNLLFVGRISPEKGLHILLDAFQQVAWHYPEVQLEIVGPEAVAPLEYIVALSDEDKVKDLAVFYPESYLSQLQTRLPSELASQVRFTGFVPYSQLHKHYLNADVLINPSLSEAFGMSLAEAMAAEIPVVAARVGGMTEVVAEGKTGLLFESGDASALAEVLLRLLSDKQLRKSMGKAGRQRVLELFSWDQIAQNMLSQYKNICNSYEKFTLESPSSPVLQTTHDTVGE